MRKPESFADEFLITHAHSFGTDTQQMTTVKEIAEQCGQFQLSLNNK